MQLNYKKTSGFTIVELLIVVVVIGILAAIVTVAYTGITQRANDSKRSAELRSIAAAIDLYYIDNGGYPRCGATGPNVSPYPLGSGTAASCLADELVPTYMSSIPTDPTNSGSYVYRYAVGYRKTGTTSYTGSPSSDNYILGVKEESSSGPYYGGWGYGDLTLLLGS